MHGISQEVMAIALEPPQLWFCTFHCPDKSLDNIQ
jgi:hypothetical protein